MKIGEKTNSRPEITPLKPSKKAIINNNPPITSNIKKRSSIYKVTISGLSSFTFEALVLIINFTASTTKNTELLTCFGHMSFFNNFVFSAITRSVVETHGILGSQAHGMKTYGKIPKIFFQSLIMNYIVFFTLGIYIALNIPQLSKILGLNLEENILNMSQNGYFWLLPGFALKILNENLKVFLQNEGKESSLILGYWLLFLLIFMIPFIIVVVFFFRIEEQAFGIVIIFYEMMVLLVLIFLIKKYSTIKPDMEGLKNFYKKFGFFFKITLQNFLSLSPVYFLGNISILYLGVMDLEIDLAVHSALIAISNGIWAFSFGYVNVSRTSINHFIGMGDIEMAKEEFMKYEIIGFIIGILIFIFQALTHFLLIHYEIYENTEFRAKMIQCYLPYSFYWAVNYNIQFYDSILRTLGTRVVFFCTNMLFVCEVFVIYFFAVYFEKGVGAIGGCLCWMSFVKSLVVRGVIKRADWDVVTKRKKIFRKEVRKKEKKRRRLISLLMS